MWNSKNLTPSTLSCSPHKNKFTFFISIYFGSLLGWSNLSNSIWKENQISREKFISLQIPMKLMGKNFSVLFAPCSRLPQNHFVTCQNRFWASGSFVELGRPTESKYMGDPRKVLGDQGKVLGDQGKVYFPSVLQFFLGSLRILEIFDNFTCPY